METIQRCLVFAGNNCLFVCFCVLFVTNILTIIIAWRRIYWLNRLVNASDRIGGITRLKFEQEKQAHERTKEELKTLKIRSEGLNTY